MSPRVESPHRRQAEERPVSERSSTLSHSWLLSETPIEPRILRLPKHFVVALFNAVPRGRDCNCITRCSIVSQAVWR
jgi:hypothetical protein